MKCFKTAKKNPSKLEKFNDADLNQPLLIGQLNENDHLNKFPQIAQIIIDIEDESKSDDFIIKSLNELPDAKKKLRDFKSEDENFSLLHYAAKYARSELIRYLIDTIKIETDISCKRKKTPFQVFINFNSIPKQTNGKKQLKMCLNIILSDEKKKRFKDTFNLLIIKGANYNLQDELGNSAMHYAVLNNSYEAITSLLNLKFVDPDIENVNLLTPFGIACKNGFEDIALLLLDKININKLINDTSDQNPLYLICNFHEEKLNVIKKIMEKVKNFDEQNSILNLTKLFKNLEIVSILINNNHLNVIEFLLKEYNKYLTEVQDKNMNSLIHLAARNGSPELLKILIKYHAFSLKNNSNNENAVHIAAQNNRFKFIKDFLANEAKYSSEINSNNINLEEEKEEDSLIQSFELENNYELYIPSVKCVNSKHLTPLFLAIIGGHLKSVEVLSTSEYIDYAAQDLEGDTIYHKCAELNNFESLRYLLTRKEQKYLDPLYIKNKNDESVIHIASHFGNLEVIRLVLSKIYDGFSSPESYLLAKNKNGLTCFHIACSKGFYNVVEYFLKDLKMKFFLESYDNNQNNGLHLASDNGHLSIVKILIEFGIDINTRNKDNYTALDLSCRKGFFDISKILISSFTAISTYYNSQNEYPLHVAAHEGSYQVVELLLSKGVPIDTLNGENKNCLDIAIQQERREVIKVLLKNENWSKLIEISTLESSPIDFKGDKRKTFFQVNNTIRASLFMRPKIRKESPQLNAMVEKKMWDMILIILDNCKMDDDFYFAKLDPPLRNIQKHPLMLMAQSGQETILKHPTVQKLLALKWRFIPRFAFYSNLFFYLSFLLLFAAYSLQLSTELNEKIDDSIEDSMLNNNNTDIYEYDSDLDYLDDGLPILLLISIGFNVLKNLFQIIIIDKLSYFNSIENLLEIFTYFMAIFTIFSDSQSTKLTYCSVAVLSSFIVFTFLIQKLRGFGLYVLAFRRTLQNSTKFFPIFLLIFTGFNLSFRLQSKFAESVKNSTEGGILLKTFVMTLGELDTDLMGFDAQSFYVNYGIFFLFIAIVCVILVNLFVGIAVGEITTVLDEADVQQISMRIIFVLKVQESLKLFIRGPISRKYLNLEFENYSSATEYKFIKMLKESINYFSRKFSSVEPSIELIDPQQRLEESMIELSRTTNSDLKSIRENLSTQISDVEHKLSNSQQRIEDYLVEMHCKTTTDFEITKEESSDSIGFIEIKLDTIAQFLNQNFEDLKILTKYSFNSIKQSFKSLIINFENKMVQNQRVIQSDLKNIFLHAKNNQEISNEEFSTVKKNLATIHDQMDRVNRSLQLIMEKLNILENDLHVQNEKSLILQSSIDETNNKIEQQKTTLMQMPKYQPKIIINKSKDNERRQSKTNMSLVKSLVNKFEQSEPIATDQSSSVEDNLNEYLDLAKNNDVSNEPKQISKETTEIKPKEEKTSQFISDIEKTPKETSEKKLPYLFVKKAFQETLNEMQLELKSVLIPEPESNLKGEIGSKIEESNEQLESKTDEKEDLLESIIPKETKMSELKHEESDNEPENLSQLKKVLADQKNISPWLKRRLKQKERRNSQKPPEDEDNT